MNLAEYMKYIYKSGIYINAKLYFDMIAMHDIGYKSEYIVVKDTGVYAIVDGEEHLMNSDPKEPLLTIRDKFVVRPGDLPNLDKEYTTSVGIYIANVIKLVYPFRDSVPYINGVFGDKYIESLLPELLRSKKVSLQEYKVKHPEATSLISTFSKLVTHAATMKALTPPPDMEEFKTNLAKEYDEKFGKDWKNDQNTAIQFINELKKHDNDYIKDDPSYGKVLSGKVTNNSRPRLFAAFGVESGFDKLGENSKFIMNSLTDGYPKDPESLVFMFNSSRSGSLDRGYETQEAGTLTKDTLRPSASLQIVETDCGTTVGKVTYISKHNYKRFNNAYMLVNGKTIHVNDMSPYIDKYVILRSPNMCKQPGENFCTMCMTENMKNYKDSIPLQGISTTGSLLNAKMKSMHKANKKTIVIKYSDHVRYYDSSTI